MSFPEKNKSDLDRIGRPRHSPLIGAIMAAMIGGMPGMSGGYSGPPETPADRERRLKAEAERIEAARLKRKRKLEQWTSTPQAKARRAIIEAAHDTRAQAGQFIPDPIIHIPDPID